MLWILLPLALALRQPDEARYTVLVREAEARFDELHLATRYEDMDSLRALVGSLHHYRTAPSLHPSLHVYVGDGSSIDLQEVTNWSRVEVLPCPGGCLAEDVLSAERQDAMWIEPGHALHINAKTIDAAETWMRPEELQALFGDAQRQLLLLAPSFVGTVRGRPVLVRRGDANTAIPSTDVGHLVGKASKQHRCYIQSDAGMVDRWLADSRPVFAMDKEAPPRVAIGVPTTSKGTPGGILAQHVLVTLLPSLLRTVTREELQASPVVLMIGFDDGDPVYDDDAGQKALLSAMHAMIPKTLAPFVSVHLYRLPRLRRVAQLWNLLFARSMAFYPSVDYFYQVNDDLTMETGRWLATFTAALAENEVVGPADPHNGLACKILTQAMVTRRHWRRFGLLYPLAFRDWKCDRWLTHAYARAKCFPSIIARNGAAAGGKCRYQQCDMPRWRMELPPV